MQCAFISALPSKFFFQHTWTRTRHSLHPARRTASFSVARTSTSPKLAMHISQAFPLFQPSSALLLAEDLYGQIFLGGIGIIFSGIVGAFVVAFLIRNNLDQFEEEIQNRDSPMSIPDKQSTGDDEKK